MIFLVKILYMELDKETEKICSFWPSSSCFKFANCTYNYFILKNDTKSHSYSEQTNFQARK